MTCYLKLRLPMAKRKGGISLLSINQSEIWVGDYMT